MPRIYTTLLVVAVALLTVGLGCKGPNAAEQAAIRPVTINYWTVFDDVSSLRAMAQEYQQLRPYVRINIRSVRYEEFDDLFVNALADDVAPDIVSMHNRWLRKYQPRLASMPGSVRVANVQVKGKYAPETVVTFQTNSLPSRNFVRSNYVETINEDMYIGNNAYGLPLAIDTIALYYNKELLDRAGIAVAPQTWEELMEAIQATTRFGSDGRLVQTGIALGTAENIPNAPDIFSLLLMQKGVDVMKDGRITFANNLRELGTSHPVLETLRFYTDFAREDKEVYTWNNTFGDALDEFVTGRSAFYLGFSFDESRIRSRAPQMNLAVIPVPQLNPARPVNVASYWFQSVVQKSENQDVAWDFIRYIASPENIQRYVEKTGQPSPLRAQLQEQAKDPILGPFANAALTAKNWYHGSEVEVANQAMRDLIEGYRAPVPERISELQRNSQLVTNAARRIQQSL